MKPGYLSTMNGWTLKKYPAGLVNMPLEKALQEILDGNQLTALYYDHLIVIVPSEKSRRESVQS
jgi:hypothetical protein